MKFLYKINSGYDGFYPRRIDERMINGQSLRLGWDKYIDVVEPGAAVWIYFLGPHKFENGVYVKGSVERVDLDRRAVFLRVREHSTLRPLTAEGLADRLSQAVAVRYRQVFVLPDDLETSPSCSITTSATSCRQHKCDECKTWQALQLVSLTDLKTPPRLDGRVDSFVPALWVIPSRSFLYSAGRPVRAAIRRTSDLFYDFKTGGKNLSYPLALAMFTVLARAERLGRGPDLIVPIPLSPDKAKNAELHRTLALAQALSPMLKVPVYECLGLKRPISKRRLRGSLRYSAAQFESAYDAALAVDGLPAGSRRVLLLDDVCTEGSTLRVASRALKAANPGLEVIATTAGQMAVRAAVRDEDHLLA